MTALVVILAVVAGVSLTLACVLARETIATANQEFHRAAHDRARHHTQVATLLTQVDAERREAAQERATLLNRIQDPAATAFASNVATMAPPGAAVDMRIN